MLNPLQGKARFGIEEWASFVGDVRVSSRGDLAASRGLTLSRG